jgi:SPP1 gp7 family putative phage head morphogenesis protein
MDNKYNWESPLRIESDYDRAIRRLMQRSFQVAGDNDIDLMNPWDLLRRIERIATSSAFNSFTTILARKMVKSTLVNTARTWRHAAREGTNSRRIYELLRNELQGPTGAKVAELIHRNAGIIRTLPSEISDRVTKHIQEETLKGKRPEQIAKEIMAVFPEATTAKATLIARTEAAKAHTALLQVRAETLGLYWYVWRTSSDGRVRKSHNLMDGVLCSFKDPPSPESMVGEKNVGHYNPGEIYNCRCFPEILTDIDDVSWPRKVHVNGRIVIMTKAQFRKVA